MKGYIKESLYIIIVILAIGIALFVIKPVLDFLLTRYIIFLRPYEYYINVGIIVVFVGGGGLLITRLIRKSLSESIKKSNNKSLQNTLDIIVSLVMYALILAVILSSLGIDLTSALVGGSIGALIMGISLQSIFSNIFAGFAATSSGALKPGESVILNSWLFGTPIVGEVERISYLFSDIRTEFGNIVKVPNSAFLGNSIFQSLKMGDKNTYQTIVMVSNDTASEKLDQFIQSYMEKENIKAEYYITSMGNGINNYTVSFEFESVKALPAKIDRINRIFNKAYWSAKSQK
ncbi:MAG: mechanosensitive ion channel family protein [Thermoplasmata archaeon]